MNHIYGILAGAMALAAVIAPGTAGTAPAQAQDVNCAAFIDEDGDGVCDYQNSNARCGYGPGFVDEDGDGVCDYRNSNAGRGYGRGNRCGRGRR